MTTPTVIELPPAMQPVTPPTFVFLAVREDSRPTAAPASARRIVD